MIARSLTLPTNAVLASALAAYGATSPGRRCSASAPGPTGALADFLEQELAAAALPGSDLASRFDQGADRIEAAADALTHIAGSLRSRAIESTSLPLPFGEAMEAEPGGTAAGPRW